MTTTGGYAVLGIALSIGGAGIALGRGRATRSFYAADVYHMTRRSHGRFAAVSAIFVLAFAAALHWSVLAVPLLAIYVLLLVLYLSSFARGFADEDE